MVFKFFVIFFGDLYIIVKVKFFPLYIIFNSRVSIFSFDLFSILISCTFLWMYAIIPWYGFVLLFPSALTNI